MKKYVTMAFGGSILTFVLLGVISKQMTTEANPNDIKPVLPNITLYTLDSTQISLHDIEYEKGLVVALVNSECQICHSQVEEFAKRGENLQGIKIILISYQFLDELKAFAEEYPQVPATFMKGEFQVLNDHFSDVNVTQALLYNQEKELIKKQVGITRVVHIQRFFEEAESASIH